MTIPFPSLTLAVLVALSSAACGGRPAQNASPGAQDATSLQARLTSGPWRLADYRPNVPLEATMRALLTQQLHTMVVTFDGQAMHAQSPFLNLARPYTLQNVAGFVFDLVSPDFQGGGVLMSHCEISDDGRRITFTAQTDPWTGTGVLQRE